MVGIISRSCIISGRIYEDFSIYLCPITYLCPSNAIWGFFSSFSPSRQYRAARNALRGSVPYESPNRSTTLVPIRGFAFLRCVLCTLTAHSAPQLISSRRERKYIIIEFFASLLPHCREKMSKV